MELLKAKNEIEEYEVKLANMMKVEKETFKLYSEGMWTLEQFRELVSGHKSEREELQRKIMEIKSSEESEADLQELKNSSLLHTLESIMTQTLTEDEYSKLVVEADVRGTVFEDRVDFSNIYGSVTLPRIRTKTRRWMPAWRIELTDNLIDGKRTFDENTIVTLYYKTGKKKDLADCGQMKIKSC